VVDVPQGPEEIEAYLGALGGSPSSRHIVFRVLRTFFRWLELRYGLPSPMAGVRGPLVRPKPMRTLALPQLAGLLGAAGSPRDRALLELLIDTGIRIGEAAGLHQADVEDDGIHVDGKTGARLVPISPGVAESLRTWLPWSGLHGPLTRSGLQQIVKRAMRRAGITGPRASAHTLRHSFARCYLMAGGDVFSLQRIMGHRDLKTTQGYLALADRDLRDQHARFSPLRALPGAAQGTFWPQGDRLQFAKRQEGS